MSSEEKDLGQNKESPEEAGSGETAAGESTLGPNTATNNRLILTKAILWFVVGVASVVAVVRYVRGLGETTALTDTTPWGLWIGFDVLAGVGLAAGGFVIAATVYIFGREKYHGIVRPAVLTAFLGYLAVIIGLLVDLGRPWNIWRMIVNWNPHSPLFEVGMCVMLYTGVLALEFAPVGLERFRWARPIVHLLRKLALPIVITGIALSTLHQSSLGTLFLLQEGRMHPLWFSPLLPAMFLVSAIGLGLAMVTFESLITSWLYKREPEWPQLRGLTRAAAMVLALFLVMRFGDLVVRGQLGHAFSDGWFSALFWVEILMSSLVPILLFSLPATRGTEWAIRWGAFLSVAGFILHRADVGGISHIAVTGEKYVPALSELAISLGVISGLGLIFLFFVEYLNVWEKRPATPDHFTPPAIDPFSRQFIGSPWLGSGQRAVLAWIFGAVVGIGLMEVQVAVRGRTEARTVAPARTLLVRATPFANGPGHRFELMGTQAVRAGTAGDTAESRFAADQTAPTNIAKALLIDSGGAGRFVLFEHEAHQERLGRETSCAVCHHRNVPLDQGTSCVHCHQDMYRVTDTFDHARHVTKHGENASCVVCHADPAAAKTRTAVRGRAGAKACNECHPPAQAAVSKVRLTGDWAPGMAPGYKTALHGLCISCHQEHEQKVKAEQPYLSLCTTCHREDFNKEADRRLRAGWSVAAAMAKP